MTEKDNEMDKEIYFQIIDDMRSILSSQAATILKDSPWKSIYEHAENIEKLEKELKS